jgi:hypothetical protein
MMIIDKVILTEYALNSKSKGECINKLKIFYKKHISYRTLNYYLNIYNISSIHMIGYNNNLTRHGTNTKIPLIDIFSGLHPLYSSGDLRKRLISENIYPAKCNGCNNDKWRDVPIPLELEHKDGNPTNHELSNLELLCPNCHAQTSTYCGGNAKRHNTKKSIIAKNKEARTAKHQHRISLVNKSDIDFSKIGWTTKLASLLDMKSQKIHDWIVTHMPEFYRDKCFKKKSRV